jgi:hypothetical protein
MKPGDLYPVWWSTGQRNEQGQPLAHVIAVLPYTGKYPEYFTHTLRLRAPNTHTGHLECAVQL